MINLTQLYALILNLIAWWTFIHEKFDIMYSVTTSNMFRTSIKCKYPICLITSTNFSFEGKKRKSSLFEVKSRKSILHSTLSAKTCLCLQQIWLCWRDCSCYRGYIWIMHDITFHRVLFIAAVYHTEEGGWGILNIIILLRCVAGRVKWGIVEWINTKFGCLLNWFYDNAVPVNDFWPKWDFLN